MSEQRWAVMCSMTGYWGVARPEHAYREDDGLLACIEWESLHDTWEEAMQEANRLARTITVTLPSPQAAHTIPAAVPDEHSIHVRTVGQLTEISAISSPGRLMRINLYHDELEPVALALLAHARKEQHRG